MSNAIKHFIWGYQQHFRVAMQTKAKNLFQKLDPSLQPEVFLVGVLAVRSNTARYPTCVEPEDGFWIDSDDFRAVDKISKCLVNQYPESGMVQSHPVAQENQHHALELRSKHDAILLIIEAHQARPANRLFYVSSPARVEEYWVCMALSLQKDIVTSNPALQRDTVQLHDYRSYSLPVSLLDAVAEQFLRYVSEELSKPDPLMPEPTEGDELLRAAGANLAKGVVWRMSNQLIGHGGNLFRDCSTISSLRYERSPGSGRILLAAKGHPATKHLVTFESPVDLRNYRAARKLLQLSFDRASLYSDSDQIFGLAEVGPYDCSKEDQFEVQIVGHHHWELRHDDQPLMTVSYGTPSLPRLPFDEQAFRNKLAAVFKGISDSATDLLLSLAKEAGQESHGTMLLISTAAAEEAKRLAPQGTPISPCLLTPQLLKHLTPIDGAILLDSEGVCHAIGTILDGRATPNGDPGRGARFNSAVRYVESLSDQAACLAVVVSEDGGVDFVPNLLPLI